MLDRKGPWIAIIGGLFIIVIGVILLVTTRSDNLTPHDGKIKIANYNSGAVCAALTPDCGYCPGEEIDKQCYLSEAEFDTYKELYSGLRAAD